MSNLIQVNGKALVTEVLQDAAGNYSVSGYAGRMEKAFGLIFLGLDKTDPEYAIQSAAAVAAIGAISERDAFDAAWAATRPVMQALGNAATFKMKDVADQVLASLCTRWFDVPDGDTVISSGSFLPFRPGKCPGHFAPPSGYIFQPEPNLILRQLGKVDGGILREAVNRFVARHRQAGTAPTGAVSGPLFTAFAAPGQEDLLARSLIGVMMGFLPTAQGNLEAVAKAWEGNLFQQLRGLWLGSPQADLYLRANEVIRRAMIEAMQAEPTPPAIWRTAISDHQLGSPPVQVKKGDRLSINLDSATHEDLDQDNPDPMPIFGGDRSQPASPTHACPGFKAAMGALMGILAGTLEAQPVLKQGFF